MASTATPDRAPAGGSAPELIEEVRISNFKLVDTCSLPLGRITVLIGENGCGKSNLLEGIGLGAAAAANKLDREFLMSRGIRVPLAPLMRSAFSESEVTKPIAVWFGKHSKALFRADLANDNQQYSPWRDTTLDRMLDDLPEELYEQIGAAVRMTPGLQYSQDAARAAAGALIRSVLVDSTRELASFMIFSPQVATLRALASESQIQPLGIYGEGLFGLLRSLETEHQLDEVKANLRLIGWFEDLEAAEGSTPADRTIRLRDQFMAAPFQLDEKSANEGFLFLLFYVGLFMSRHTPTFFVVDNVDCALNPKLASRLMSTIIQLAKKHGKQAIITTHNPSVLDGLDLSDDEQRLLVVYRNIEGRTRGRRISRGDLPPGAQSVRLSEAFLRGYIGGLPSSF